MLLLQTNVFQLFVSGGYLTMSIITLLLVALFFAAWKAPAWVKEVGLLALAFGFLWTIIGFMQAGWFIQGAETEVAANVIWGGVRVGLIPVAYGLIVYLISLVIRIIQKPRI